MPGIENKLYLLLLLLPVIINLFLHIFKQNIHYISILSIIENKTNINILRKIEKLLFYLIYILVVLFLSKPYIIDVLAKKDVIFLIDNSYSTSITLNNSDRFSQIINKATDLAKDMHQDKIFYINYEIEKKKITDKAHLSNKKLNIKLLKSFIDTNLKIGNRVIFFTDGVNQKADLLTTFKENVNFYYYVVGGGVTKNYCISKISYKSLFLRKNIIHIYLENYNINLPAFIKVDNKIKAVKTPHIRLTLPFYRRFVKVELPHNDECSYDNNVTFHVYNAPFKIVYKVKKPNGTLNLLKKKIHSKSNKKLLITDRTIKKKFYKTIYTGLSLTQKPKYSEFNEITRFDNNMFYGINSIFFLKKEMLPHFVFLEGKPLLATDYGYLILESGKDIITSFKTDENITISNFWNIFLWKRILEFAADNNKKMISIMSFYPDCNLSTQNIESKEFTKTSYKTKLYLVVLIKKILLFLIPTYIVLFIILMIL